MTRGLKSSERKACYDSFYFGFTLAAVGLIYGVDLTQLSYLIVSVSAPLMWYAGNRTAFKIKHGENEDGIPKDEKG